MDEDCTIPQYHVLTYYGEGEKFERRMNELALDGWEVFKFSTNGSEQVVYNVIMVKRVSRLEILVRDGKVVK